MNKVKENLKKFDIDVLVAIGGDDTLSVANALCEMQIPCVGIPKTIDNDLSGTDYTFGFDTAVSIATDAIDRLHTTAESHQRVMVIELMGRHTGWIAVFAGLAGGADCILIPEVPFSIKDVIDSINRRKSRGKNFSIVVVAEGAKPEETDDYITQSDRVDDFGHKILGGIGELVSNLIEKESGLESRFTKLGHIQRGGTPTAFDRVLATRLGVAAADMINEKKFGYMAALKSNKIISVPINEALSQKRVDMELYEIAKVFFG